MVQTKFGRTLLDKDGNRYVVEIPMDVNPDSVRDILSGAQSGIVKVLAYRLVGEEWRGPDAKSLPDEAKRSVRSPFYAKLNVFDGTHSVTQEEFGAAMLEILTSGKERAGRINRPRITKWGDYDVHEDVRGLYIEREIPCAARCGATIKGQQRLSINDDGEPTQTQHFISYDSGAHRVKSGSKNWLCSACAVKSTKGPGLEKPPVPEKEAPAPKPKEIEGKTDDIWTKIEAMSAPDSEVDPVFLKGFIHGIALLKR